MKSNRLDVEIAKYLDVMDVTDTEDMGNQGLAFIAGALYGAVRADLDGTMGEIMEEATAIVNTIRSKLNE